VENRARDAVEREGGSTMIGRAKGGLDKELVSARCLAPDHGLMIPLDTVTGSLLTREGSGYIEIVGRLRVVDIIWLGFLSFMCSNKSELDSMERES